MSKRPLFFLELAIVCLVLMVSLTSCNFPWYMLTGREKGQDLPESVKIINTNKPREVTWATEEPVDDLDMPEEPTGVIEEDGPPIVIVIPANPALANPPTAEEKAPLPDQPVTYTGDMSGVLFSMTVVFQTGEVTGTLEWTDGNSYSNATIEGRIDTATLAVITAYSGVIGDAKYGVETSISGAITGTISVDYSTFAASWVNESGDRGEFTAYR